MLEDANGLFTVYNYTESSALVLEVDDFACTCNCTYASTGCCFEPTKIIYEALRMKVDATQMASYLRICCDVESGRWVNSTIVRDRASKDLFCPI